MTALYLYFRHLKRLCICPCRFSIIVLFFFIAMLTGPGCAWFGPHFEQQAKDPQAKEAMTRIQAFNAQITSSKGTGELTLSRGFRKERYKIAWAAQSPNLLRMTLLMSGHPVETIASTGDWVTFVSHTGAHKPHSAVSSDPDLEPYINVPLRLSDLVSLLLGKVPKHPFDRAWTVPEKPDTVFASKSFSPKIQEFLTDETGKASRYRVLDKKMNMIFGIWYSRFYTRDNFIVPGVITIMDMEQRSIEICLTNLMPNIPLKESVFRLTQP